MRLFIFEYFASGAKKDPIDLKKAGFAMLDAVLKDFTQLSHIQISTMLDCSLGEHLVRAPYADKLDIFWREQGEKNTDEHLEECLEQCDAVLMIAPETNGTIAQFTARAEDRGKMILGSSAQTLELVCNKENILRFLESKGLPVPKSKVLRKPFSVHTKVTILEHFSLPLVIKPVSGTGGEGVTLVKTEPQLEHLLEEMAGKEDDSYLVQEFVCGQDVSVSCFVLDGKVLPLSLNRQIIQKEDELLFSGVTVPFIHPGQQAVFGVVSEACKRVQGLRGFVGVDLVLGASGPVIMEINSRITSAYVALREVVPGNLAKDLWFLCREHCFPDPPEIKGTFTYLVNTQKERAEACRESLAWI
ncbi:ATP-grasp domain-containing protein [Candidatus Formimonas warabiya]|uniref:ATP-grasp domain-containing protein n=1 Tax=Formimonas warabiya TaxID=1761012 RepID=A0A3G1KNI6_FORW1|nr:ATP-grasp domain-containing protein [Candidatus Formimonas warabiya]ATW24051.1 hypothetical protein DCMF_03940 [Candidatus Formimonas warabiya]